MKKILVPTDFSEQAEYALKVAADLARKHDSEIYLLHLLELPLELVGGGAHNLPESIFFMKHAHKQFEEVLAKDYFEGLQVHETVEFQTTFEGINEAAAKRAADIIIMGSHGASGFKEMFIGSNTEKVVRTSEVPVLVIKTDHQGFEVKEFVFATDFTKESKKAFSQAANFANILGARLHLLYVNTASDFKTNAEIDDIMANYADGESVDNLNLTVYNDYTAEKGILNFARSVDADLIGMGTHGRKGLSHFFNGSISEDLVNHAKRPVITFKI